MEQRNNLVLQGTETFSRGQLDNVALESGRLVLGSAAGRHPGVAPRRSLPCPRSAT